jgi:hypothetical protein
VFLPVAIRAYQDAFFDFLLGPRPTPSQSVLRNTKILPPIGVMEFERTKAAIIPATGTLSALVFYRAQPHRLATLRDGTFQILWTVSISSFVWHTSFSIPRMLPQSPALPLSYTGINFQATLKQRQYTQTFLNWQESALTDGFLPFTGSFRIQFDLST